MKAEDSQQVDANEEERGWNAGGALSEAETDATTRKRTIAEPSGLLEAVCERDNRMLVCQRVVES